MPTHSSSISTKGLSMKDPDKPYTSKALQTEICLMSQIGPQHGVTSVTFPAPHTYSLKQTRLLPDQHHAAIFSCGRFVFKVTLCIQPRVHIHICHCSSSQCVVVLVHQGQRQCLEKGCRRKENRK